MLSIEHLSKVYDRNRSALDDVSFQIETHTFTAVWDRAGRAKRR